MYEFQPSTNQIISNPITTTTTTQTINYTGDIGNNYQDTNIQYSTTPQTNIIESQYISTPQTNNNESQYISTTPQTNIIETQYITSPQTQNIE